MPHHSLKSPQLPWSFPHTGIPSVLSNHRNGKFYHGSLCLVPLGAAPTSHVCYPTHISQQTIRGTPKRFNRLPFSRLYSRTLLVGLSIITIHHSNPILAGKKRVTGAA